MGVENIVGEPMNIEAVPSTSGYNIKNKEKDKKSANLPWYVSINKYIISKLTNFEVMFLFHN